MARRGQVPIIVLFYHRVADDFPNDWTISRAAFQQQIDWIETQFEFVDLEECQRRIASGYNAAPTISITFDDGYAENCEFGIPLLLERRIPVTYFVTTEHTRDQKTFPHDLDRNRPLPINSIESLSALAAAGVEIGGHTYSHANLGSISDPRQLVDEVVGASLELEKLVGCKIRYFAFPYGLIENLNADVFAILKQAGFLGACSAFGGWNNIGGDAFHIQRLHGDPNFERLKNWLGFDPRLAKCPPFDTSQGDHPPELLRELVDEACNNHQKAGQVFPATSFPNFESPTTTPLTDPTCR